MLGAITQSELKQILHYEPETGEFTWLVDAAMNVRAGSVAGWGEKGGYTRITIFRRNYLAHRLAFLFMTGALPLEEVDHINRVKADNRWCNLRAVSRAENGRNRSFPSTNTSGAMGVRWHVASGEGRWLAYIGAGRSYRHLGRFASWFEAVCARKSAEVKLGYHPNHGRAAR